MTGAAVALLVVGIGVLALLALLVRAVVRLSASIEAMHRDQAAVLAEAEAMLEQARAEVERADAVLETAQSLSGTVDSASRLAYLTLSNPVVKTMAFATGTGRAARRLRQPARR